MEKEYSFGERLNEMRSKKYKTQEDFSIAADCSHEYINQLENDKSEPSLSQLKNMAKAMDMPVYLMVKELLNE